jgi:phosphoglycolate phosphatase
VVRQHVEHGLPTVHPVTSPIDDPETLRRILANTEALLLDFDGPICSVFSDFPAPVVADQLRGILAEGGHTTLPEHIQAATDPFDILFYAATLGPTEARYVEAAFTAHEVEAVQTAMPTVAAHDLIHVWKATGRPLAIVSNNSAAAIEVYLNIHDLVSQIDSVAARISVDTTLLKPSPYLVLQVVVALNRTPAFCLLLGDSAADIQAAKAAKTAAIGYANKQGKHNRLVALRPDAVVDRLEQVVDAL